MKTIGIILIIIACLTFGLDIYNAVYANWEYSRDIESSWSLADKASTIPQKAEYVDKFVQALESTNLQGTYNAVFLTTPDNSFDYNLKALKSLQARLHEITGMDITSFAYQTAIQQITAQEQGEAHRMLKVFEGCWWKAHHFFLWDWVCVVQILFFCIICIAGGIMIAVSRI